MLRSKSFNIIQILRFLAAFLVVLYHAQLMISSYFPKSASYPFLHYGQYGVDLFFVISGFIIVYVAETRETSARVFASRRIQRVIPMYYLVTVAVFAMANMSGMTRGTAPSVGDLIRSLLFASWLKGANAYPVVNVGWTLEYEVFFYFIFAASLLISKRPWLIAAGIMSVIVLMGQGQPVFPVNAIILEFILGMAIRIFISNRRDFIMIALAIIFVLLMLPPSPARDRVFMYGLPATGIVVLAVYLDIRNTYRGEILKELGNASYSIYLVHVVTISIACKLLAKWAPQAPSWLTVPFVSLIGIVVGYATYRLLERPVMKLFSHRRQLQIAVPSTRSKTKIG